MNRAIKAEVRKLTTTRTVYLTLLAVVAAAIVSVVDADYDAAQLARPLNEQPFAFFTSLLTRLFILVMGIRIVTDEFRHGTLVPSLLVVPWRNQVVAAKAIVALGTGALLALAGMVTMVGAAAGVAATREVSIVVDVETWRALTGMVAAGALWAVVGVGVGSVVRNQVVAIVGALVWLMALEDAFRGRLGEAGGYLPGQAGLALSLAPSGRGLLVGGVTMAAYAVGVVAVGTLAMRRDVS